MYIAKIPGTKYVTSLESQSGEWYLRLKLDGTVEAEVELEQLSKRNLQTKLGELYDKVQLQINSFQIDLIHKELTSQIQHLLIQEAQKKEIRPASTGDDAKQDPRVDLLFDKLDRLEKSLNVLSERLDRMEALTK